MNENENTITQNLWDTVKAVLRGKFIAIQAHLKKQEKSQINNLTLHLKQLEKEEMKNPRVSRWQCIFYSHYGLLFSPYIASDFQSRFLQKLIISVVCNNNYSV